MLFLFILVLLVQHCRSSGGFFNTSVIAVCINDLFPSSKEWFWSTNLWIMRLVRFLWADNSNKTNDDDSSDTSENSMIPIVDSKTESMSNNSITLPDSQDTLNKNSEPFYQIRTTELQKNPKKSNIDIPTIHDEE